MRFAESKCIIWVYEPNENGMKTNYHLSNPRSLEFATQEFSLLPLSNNICLSNQDQFILELLLRSHRLRRAGNAGLGKIQTTSILDILVHPNPTTGKVYFETVQGNLGDAEVQFFDMSGRTVQAIKSATSANQLNYDLNDLPSGLYIYQLKYSNGDIYAGKVIKE